VERQLGDKGHGPEGTREPAQSMARSILEAAHEAFVSMDAGGFITDWNREAERTFGWSRTEVIGMVLADTIVPERYRGAHLEGLQHYRETGEAPVLGVRLELSAVHRDGHEFPVEMTISAVHSDGRPSFHAFLHDISARKFSERLLVAQRAVTHALASAASPAVSMEAVLRALGESMDWGLGAYWAVDSSEGVLRRAASWCAPTIAAEEFERERGELRLALGVGLPGHAWAQGEPVWVEDLTAETSLPRMEAAGQVGLRAAICVPVLRGGDVVGVIEFLARELRLRDRSVSDVLVAVGAQTGQLLGILEERLELLTKLETLALTDQLTGLANRRAWDEGLRRELARASRDGHPVCVALIDLDHFKRFNDESGHQAGDALLTGAAADWLAVLRAGDFLARYGGDEFAAIFPAQSLETAVAVVERLRVATPAAQSCSAGVALWNTSETAEQLVGRADAALYEAKQTGRHKTVAAP
jgi:diguanylate cyclase (GGDEF)-like protein/PAS domain S-box-containing protein